MNPSPGTSRNKLREMAAATERKTLREAQEPEVNYYVLVPFTSMEGALWGAGHVATHFDCHVVSSAAVDQDTIDYTGGSLNGGDE